MRRALLLVVFASGAASLSIEICASRLLGPYFGNSTVVWANVIGLILVYLSVGYWAGGRIADRHPTPQVLGFLLVVAAIATAILPFVAHPFLDLALRGFVALSVSAVVGSFFATLLLFFIPVSLLGMASPFALRLSIADIRGAGTISGRLSALATVGAIVGTFASALLLIPAVGTQRTMLIAALVVALASLPLWLRLAAPAAALIAVALAIPPAAVKPISGTIAEEQTAYQFVQVVRTADGKVVMRTDEGVADQSVYRAGYALTGGEWDMPLVVPPLLNHSLRTALVLGNAGGSTARALAAEYRGVRIDGVEIDPALSDLARRYMAMGSVPRLHVITADAREFLESSSQRYDLIIVDAYRQTYIPFYLATSEFFRLVRDHLRPGGAVAHTVARVPGDVRLAQAISTTLADVFPQTWLWPALRFNELVVGLQTPVAYADLRSRFAHMPSSLQVLAPLVLAAMRTVSPSSDELTDDHAPVEWLTDRAVLAYIAAGGRLNEHLLPTAP